MTDILKNRILFLTYVYRSLPVKFLRKIAIDSSEKETIRTIVNNLIKQDYLISKKSLILEEEFIRLSLKGYKYVVSNLLNDPKKPFYQYKTSRSLLKPIYIHSFLNFAFIWHFYKKQSKKAAAQLEVYEDSDINNCKIPFSYKGKDVLISPDVLIFTPQNNSVRKVIIVENDTGRETYKMIYHKIIEYAALAEEGMAKHKIGTIELYFVMLSKRRIQSLFAHSKGFLRFFGLDNKTSRGLEVRMRYLLQTLNNGKLQIFLSHYDSTNPKNPYVFRQYDLKEKLIQKEAAWRNFL